MENKEKIISDQNTLSGVVSKFIQFGNADVFAFGPWGSIVRLGEIAGYALMLRTSDGKPLASIVTIILPPMGGRTSESMISEIKEGVRLSWQHIDGGDEPTAEFKAYFNKRVRIKRMEDFSAEDLLASINKAGNREFVIVGEASLYRHPSVQSTAHGPFKTEDIWCAHLHHLMCNAEKAAKTNGSYIVLDIAAHLPSRQENIDLLMSVGDVGIANGEFAKKMSSDEILSHVEKIYSLADRGDVGAALDAIDKESRMSESSRWLLRLEVFCRGGLRDQVSDMLDEFSNLAVNFDVRSLVKMASIAAETDRNDMAQSLLEQALPDLRSETDLEYALKAAHEIGRRPLIEAVSDKLRGLHRNSEQLLLDKATAAACDGDYATAATVLAAVSDATDRKRAKMFALLAEGVISPDFETPTMLSRILCGKLPEFTANIQYELIRSLERCGRRSSAIEFLLSDDIVWTGNWFSVAAGLFERTLVADTQIVTEKMMSALLQVCIEHLSKHPGDALARISIANLLDATKSGTVGMALLAATADGSHPPAFSLMFDRQMFQRVAAKSPPCQTAVWAG